MTAPKINDVLNNKAPEEKEVKQTPQSIINSESISVRITHEKSGTE
jgi:hypothetical protein